MALLRLLTAAALIIAFKGVGLLIVIGYYLIRGATKR